MDSLGLLCPFYVQAAMSNRKTALLTHTSCMGGERRLLLLESVGLTSQSWSKPRAGADGAPAMYIKNVIQI